MSKLQFTVVITRPIETVFRVLTDLAHYDKWLSSSALYSKITHISDHPIQVGTTYIDQGTTTIMQGEVIALQAPTTITFHQVLQAQHRIFGKVDFQIHYHLEMIEGGTRVNRMLTLDTRGLLALLQPTQVDLIRKENERILQTLKRYLEAR